MTEKLSCLKEWKQRCKLWAEGDKLDAEGRKLWAEGRKLYAEGDLVFINAVIKKHDNIAIEWATNGCVLGNGETYKEAGR